MIRERADFDPENRLFYNFILNRVPGASSLAHLEPSIRPTPCTQSHDVRGGPHGDDAGQIPGQPDKAEAPAPPCVNGLRAHDQTWAAFAASFRCHLPACRRCGIRPKTVESARQISPAPPCPSGHSKLWRRHSRIFSALRLAGNAVTARRFAAGQNRLQRRMTPPPPTADSFPAPCASRRNLPPESRI